MTRPPYDVRRLLESLAEGPVPEPEGPAEIERRKRIARAVDERLEQLAAARTRNRRRAVGAGVGAAFVAGAAAAWMVLKAPAVEREVATLEAAAPVEIHRSGSPTAWTSRGRIEANDELYTPSETTATAVLASGANVEVEPDSKVRFEAHTGAVENPGEALTLSHGTVVLRVPKLGSYRTLSVLTPDARVTVRGTRFSVSVLGDDDRRETRVHVTEGSVWVDHAGKEDVLAAGQSWSSRADGAAAAESSRAPAAPPRDSVASAGTESATEVPHHESALRAEERPSGDSEHEAAGQAASRPRESTPSPIGTSTLAAENELYRRAVAAARGGDDARAVSLLDTFLSRFPGSPLAQNAAVERLRALVRAGRHDSAARAANQYLSAYPSGFAREEASRVAGRSGSSREP